MTEHVNRSKVEERIGRLREAYGSLYTESERVTVSPDGFPEEIELSRDGYHGSAYAWIVRDPEDAPGLTPSMPEDAETRNARVLLILGRGGTQWGIPGGGIETGESLEETVYREVREETQIECEITDCFGLRHERRTAPGHDVVLHNIRAVFDATYTGGNISVQPGELAGAAWWPERPPKVHPLAVARADRWFSQE
jgi:8-oxo-dGTP diphosphatase